MVVGLLDGGVALGAEAVGEFASRAYRLAGLAPPAAVGRVRRHAREVRGAVVHQRDVGLGLGAVDVHAAADMPVMPARMLDEGGDRGQKAVDVLFELEEALAHGVGGRLAREPGRLPQLRRGRRQPRLQVHRVGDGEGDRHRRP